MDEKLYHRWFAYNFADLNYIFNDSDHGIEMAVEAKTKKTERWLWEIIIFGDIHIVPTTLYFECYVDLIMFIKSLSFNRSLNESAIMRK